MATPSRGEGAPSEIGPRDPPPASEVGRARMAGCLGGLASSVLALQRGSAGGRRQATDSLATSWKPRARTLLARLKARIPRLGRYFSTRLGARGKASRALPRG